MNIGIDVGGMSIKAGLVTDSGELIYKHSVPTPLDTNDNFMKAMRKAIDLAIENSGYNGKIDSIGIGSPGIVYRESGELGYCNNIPYDNVPVRKYLEKEYNAPVYVENDANCAALGEYYVSGSQDNFVFITLGTGVGGGIIIDGKLYIGSNGAGGELGHIITHAGGRSCSCGRKGCWEAYASVSALIDFTKEISGSLNIENGNINGKTVFEEAKKGNDAALCVRDRWIEEIAIGITDVVNIFQPSEVVIGGAVSKEGDALLLPLREYVSKYEYCASTPDIPKVKINLSRISDNAGIIGAALLGRNYKEQVIK